LDELIAGLARQGVSIPSFVQAAAVLTAYAWESRYPGLSERVTREEQENSVELAGAVVAWADAILCEME
jgi:HEPN domain-containing protein